MLAAITLLALFYGLKQTNYQEIDYRDFKLRLFAPGSVPDFIKRTRRVQFQAILANMNGINLSLRIRTNGYKGQFLAQWIRLSEI